VDRCRGCGALLQAEEAVRRRVEVPPMADGECSFKATISTQEEEALSRGNDGVCARFGTGGGGGIQAAGEALPLLEEGDHPSWARLGLKAKACWARITKTSWAGWFGEKEMRVGCAGIVG
jgi:hypothetical protein